jgi:hypothetical protein
MVQRHGTERSQGSAQAPNIGETVWTTIVGWVREESAAASALVLAFIALGIAFEWWHWSPAQTGAVVGITAALLGMFVRSQVTPICRLRPKAGQPGASGRGMGNGSQDELDSGVRVLPGTGTSGGPAGRPNAGMAGGQPTRPDLGPPGGQPTRPDLGPPSGQPTRPDLGPPSGQPTRPDLGPPGGQPTRPDLGPPGRPNSPPGFPGPGLLP